MSNATPQAGASEDAASQESEREMSQQVALGAGAEVTQAEAHLPGGPEGGPQDVLADGADEALSFLSAPVVSHTLVDPMEGQCCTSVSWSSLRVFVRGSAGIVLKAHPEELGKVTAEQVETSKAFPVCAHVKAVRTRHLR